MRLRRDALAGAAEFVLCAEALAKRERDLVATVGLLETRPGAPNVIPGEVTHSLDVRHPDDAIRRRALTGLCSTAEGIARARHLKVDWMVTQEDDAVAASPDLVALLRSSVRAAGVRPLLLASGAGHDAVVVSRIAPVSMLFVRCRDGLSHHPDEYAAPKDLATALDVTVGSSNVWRARERAGSRFDLVVRGAEVVLPDAVERLDIGVQDGRIVALEPTISEDARENFDATGLVAFPGIVDAHVHFNEPGRDEWEGLATGSAALAAGGGTTFFDMPLNSTPPVLDRASFEAKRGLAEQKSVLDFGVWGGLTPRNLDRIGELAAAGVVGLKAFLCASGIDDFEAIADRPTLRRAMREAARYGLLVAVHAEDDPLARNGPRRSSRPADGMPAPGSTRGRSRSSWRRSIARSRSPARPVAVSTWCTSRVRRASNASPGRARATST